MEHAPAKSKTPTTHTLKAPRALLAPLLQVLEGEPLVTLHAAAVECLRVGVAALAKEPDRLVALVREEKARQRVRAQRPGG
jgi:hypothetical protein